MTPTIEDQSIGNKLRERRTKIGISQTQLGRFEDLTFQQIQKYETGKNRISAGKLWRFTKILHVDISYFFDGLDEIIENIENKDTTNLQKFNKKVEKLDPEIRKLNKSFLEIKDRKLRKNIIELAKRLAENNKKTE